MIIILLRHEERGYDISFNSELTDNGIINSFSLINKLKKYNIDIIFSSPFIRTLQTIYPYASKYKKLINLDYGLYEYIHNPYFLLTKWHYNINEIQDRDLQTIINKNYRSIVNENDFSILEDENDLSRRLIKFFNYLKQNYDNKTILIVSHKGVINKIKDLFVKKTNMDEEFDMGHIEIYNI
jgi:broad specificity phosphatase PhoE